MWMINFLSAMSGLLEVSLLFLLCFSMAGRSRIAGPAPTGVNVSLIEMVVACKGEGDSGLD